MASANTQSKEDASLPLPDWGFGWFIIGEYYTEPSGDEVEIILDCVDDAEGVRVSRFLKGRFEQIELPADPSQSFSVPIIVDKMTATLRELLDFWVTAGTEVGICSFFGGDMVALFDLAGNIVVEVAGDWGSEFIQSPRATWSPMVL